MIAGERLYLTADRKKVVVAGDETAAFLFAPKGAKIPDAVAKKFGLLAETPDPVENRETRITGKLREK